MPQQVTWVEKVLSLIGDPPRRGEVPRLAKASGLPRRTLAAWLKGTNVPKDPTQNGVIASLAVALKVSPDWLLDGQAGAPPPKHEGGMVVTAEMLRSVPRRYHRFLYSLADLKRLDLYVAYCAFLDGQEQRS